MTDKEKRELKDGVISIFKRFNILDHTATIGGLRNDILRYIDSLQEEPETKFKIGDRIRLKGTTVKGDTITKIYTSEVGNTYFEFKNSGDASADLDWELVEEPVSIWHNMDEVPIKGEVIVVQTKDTFYGLSVQKGGTTYKNKNKDRYVRWAYASDLHNLSNVQRTVKDWKEEPVSEDLEKAAVEIAKKITADTNSETVWSKTVQGVIAGAKWQEKQDQSTIELAEDHAMLAGMEKMKEEMMKDAVDGQLENGEDYLRIKCLSMGCQPQDDGKLVKLIIFKED